jgi:hypothetical protein
MMGENLDIRGQQTVSFRLGGNRFEHTFLVCPLPTEIAGILGTDFLESAKAQISFEIGEKGTNSYGKCLSHVRSDTHEPRCAYSVH